MLAGQAWQWQIDQGKWGMISKATRSELALCVPVASPAAEVCAWTGAEEQIHCRSCGHALAEAANVGSSLAVHQKQEVEADKQRHCPSCTLQDASTCRQQHSKDPLLLQAFMFTCPTHLQDDQKQEVEADKSNCTICSASNDLSATCRATWSAGCAGSSL